MIPSSALDLFDGSGYCKLCGAMVPAGIWLYDHELVCREARGIHYEFHLRVES